MKNIELFKKTKDYSVILKIQDKFSKELKGKDILDCMEMIVYKPDIPSIKTDIDTKELRDSQDSRYDVQILKDHQLHSACFDELFQKLNLTMVDSFGI